MAVFLFWFVFVLFFVIVVVCLFVCLFVLGLFVFFVFFYSQVKLTVMDANGIETENKTSGAFNTK